MKRYTIYVTWVNPVRFYVPYKSSDYVYQVNMEIVTESELTAKSYLDWYLSHEDVECGHIEVDFI